MQPRGSRASSKSDQAKVILRITDRATSQVRVDCLLAIHSRDEVNKRHVWEYLDHRSLPVIDDGDCLNVCDDLAICRSDSRLQLVPKEWLSQQPRARSSVESNSFGGQASKGIRWMPWLQEAKKDVVKLR